MAERDSSFWIQEELKLTSFESQWQKEFQPKENKDYGGEDMEAGPEQFYGNRLALAGPMIDGYLKQIGKIFKRKLSRGNHTGLAPPETMYIPWGIMKYLCGLSKRYGCEIKPITNSNKKKGKLVLTCNRVSTANKLFDTSRFNGENFLAKRIYRKALNEQTKKNDLALQGSAEVVVSKNTPIQLTYKHDDNNLRITFYIQRYTADGYAVDASLQALMNQEE